MTARMMPPSRLHRHDAQQPMTKLIHQRRKLCTPPCACCSVDRLLDHVVVARPLDHDVVDRAAHGRAGVSSASVVFDRRTGCLAGRQRGPVAGGCSAGFHKANKDRRRFISHSYVRNRSENILWLARSQDIKIQGGPIQLKTSVSTYCLSIGFQSILLEFE